MFVIKSKFDGEEPFVTPEKYKQLATMDFFQDNT